MISHSRDHVYRGVTYEQGMDDSFDKTTHAVMALNSYKWDYSMIYNQLVLGVISVHLKLFSLPQL